MRKLIAAKLYEILSEYRPHPTRSNTAIIEDMLERYCYDEIGVSNEGLWKFIDELVEEYIDEDGNIIKDINGLKNKEE